MSAVLRVAFVAFGSMFAVSMCRAQPVALPPIFEVRPAGENRNAAAAPATPSAISGRARGLINAAAGRALVDAKAFGAPVRALVSSTAAESASGEPVLMERYIVESKPLRLIERRLPDPPLLDFLKTGAFYRNPDSKGLTHVGLMMMILKQPGLGWGQEFTRGQIEFTFRW